MASFVPIISIPCLRQQGMKGSKLAVPPSLFRISVAVLTFFRGFGVCTVSQASDSSQIEKSKGDVSGPYACALTGDSNFCSLNNLLPLPLTRVIRLLGKWIISFFAAEQMFSHGQLAIFTKFFPVCFIFPCSPQMLITNLFCVIVCFLLCWAFEPFMTFSFTYFTCKPTVVYPIPCFTVFPSSCISIFIFIFDDQAFLDQFLLLAHFQY